MNLAVLQASWVQDPTTSQTEDHAVLEWAVLDQTVPGPELTLDLLVTKLSHQLLCREWLILIEMVSQAIAQALINQEPLQQMPQARLTAPTQSFVEH